MKYEIFHISFPVSSLGKNLEMDNIVADSEGKYLTSKISEPSIESETDNGDNCATNTCPKTI